MAISRTSAKKADVTAMGADRFIATDEDEDWAARNANSLDLIVSTVSSPRMPLAQYLRLLRVRGQFIQVGAPDDAIPAFNAFALIVKGIKIGGSAIGGPDLIREMLDLAATRKVKPWIQSRSMTEANKAIVDMEGGSARYRYVLVNENQGGKL